jgi:hypothetical protein
MRAKNGWLPFSTGLSQELVLKGGPLALVHGSNRCMAQTGAKGGTFSTGLSHKPVLKGDRLHATPLAPVRGSNRC